jgi:chromosome segregation ATPase
VQDKIKFVLFGLIAAIIIMLFLFLQSVQNAGKLRTERDNLKESGNALTAQLDKLSQENTKIKQEFASAKNSLEKVEAEKAEFEKNFKSLADERDKLKVMLDQLNAKMASGQPVAAKPDEAKEEVEAASSPNADAYWAGILKKKAELELRLETFRSDLKAAKLETEQLKREKDKLELDLQTYETDQKDASREFEYNKKLADNLTAELAREKNDKFQLGQTLKALKSENKFLKSQLKAVYDRKTKLENKFSELQDKNAALESNMAKMESFVREKILQVDSLRTDLGIMPEAENQKKPSGKSFEDFSAGKKSSIELAPIVVKPGEEDLPNAPAQNKVISVIAVNRDNNFVILNIGSSSGVKTKDIFRIFKKDALAAEVQVTQVRENISACDINNESMAIAVGDIAK